MQWRDTRCAAILWLVDCLPNAVLCADFFGTRKFGNVLCVSTTSLLASVDDVYRAVGKGGSVELRS